MAESEGRFRINVFLTQRFVCLHRQGWPVGLVWNILGWSACHMPPSAFTSRHIPSNDSGCYQWEWFKNSLKWNHPWMGTTSYKPKMIICPRQQIWRFVANDIFNTFSYTEYLLFELNFTCLFLRAPLVIIRHWVVAWCRTCDTLVLLMLNIQGELGQFSCCWCLGPLCR